MGVNIRKRGAKWYVYVNYHGRRKNRCVGTREAAERVRREIEARPALGDQAFLQDGAKPVPLFKDFAGGWLETYAEVRHTFGSLLIQDGASLAYVKDQMGHSSIQITVDTYGHLIPGADIAWVDRLDSKPTPHQDAPAGK